MTQFTGSGSAYEVHGTHKEDFNDSEFTASVSLRCPWSQRHQIMDDILIAGRQWPYSSRYCVAKTGSIVPEKSEADQDGQGFIYKFAILTINYSSKRDNNENSVSESIEPTCEFLTLDYRRFRWGSANGDPLIEAEAPGKQIKGLNLIRKYQRVPNVPSGILAAMGAVNSAPYSSQLLGMTFPAESLLFQPPSLDRVITYIGNKGWNVQLKFSCKPDGWNKYWRAKSQAYEYIYLAGGGIYRSYPMANFSGFLS